MSQNRRYRVQTDDYARNSRSAERNPYEEWLRPDVEDRQLIRRPITTQMARRQDYRDIRYGDDSSDDDTAAGQLVIRRPASNTTQSLTHREHVPQRYTAQPRTQSRHEPERSTRSEIHYSAEPTRTSVYREQAPSRREPLRQVRRDSSSSDDTARLRNISRLEGEIADLEQRLRDCGSGSCAPRSRPTQSSSRHNDHGSAHSGHNSRRYRVTYLSSSASRYEPDSEDHDNCPCCEGTCDC